MIYSTHSKATAILHVLLSTNYVALYAILGGHFKGIYGTP